MNIPTHGVEIVGQRDDFPPVIANELMRMPYLPKSKKPIIVAQGDCIDCPPKVYTQLQPGVQAPYNPNKPISKGLLPRSISPIPTEIRKTSKALTTFTPIAPTEKKKIVKAVETFTPKPIPTAIPDVAQVIKGPPGSQVEWSDKIGPRLALIGVGAYLLFFG